MFLSKSSSKKDEKRDKKNKSNWGKQLLKTILPSENKTINCHFLLCVDSITDLPPNFSDVSLCVHWKVADIELSTSPVKVVQGKAVFDQESKYSCSINTKIGPQHYVKYDAVECLLYASVYGASGHDLGQHLVDLSRLLPLTLEDEEVEWSGIWRTSYKLSGRGKCGILHVSFEYSMTRHFKKSGDMRRVTSINSSSRPVVDPEILFGVFPVAESGHSRSVSMFSQSSVTEQITSSEHVVEISLNEQVNTIDHLDTHSDMTYSRNGCDDATGKSENEEEANLLGKGNNAEVKGNAETMSEAGHSIDDVREASNEHQAKIRDKKKQLGSRWLIAKGMGKSSEHKNPFVK